jgi:hypothetical protein
MPCGFGYLPELAIRLGSLDSPLGRICILGQLVQMGEERRRLANEQPMSVKNLTTPMAIPFVSVGRMIEHFGRVELRNGHGSGMIRFVCARSPC